MIGKRREKIFRKHLTKARSLFTLKIIFRRTDRAGGFRKTLDKGNAFNYNLSKT